MKQYLLLLRGKGALDYSPEELQRRLEEYREWVGTIQEYYISANRLEREGTLITGKGEIKTDGPFLESKEIIAGYIIIQALDLEKATEISMSCPLLKYFEIMVRPMVMQE
ncbi:YciI family protein [Fulvivirga lutimaris]|uniref:YciI family protein n=1 Tax=Fulvivirga lutimaris TaxID=1819566 RepID=UPI0012BB8964|nr:YciI family protein [Fulvivirga lutimaris]MTI38829.1 hypothetical protein [Fulvivirga lutimaris]